MAKQALDVASSEIKANFDQIYTQDDPREYFRVLHGLDYIIPGLARPVFRRICDTLTELRGRPINILDVGCSYGINAALLRAPLSMGRLAARYADLQASGVSSTEVMALDRRYFGSWPRVTSARFTGLDISEPAITYATNSGILDRGFAEDLENNEPSARLRDALADIDLVISTGCIGYVSEKTFSRVMGAIRTRNPWVASFVLRLYPFAPIGEVLTERSLATEKLESVTFVQRRFHSEREYADTLEALRGQGVDPRGKEEDGLLHAEFFLSRPSSERERMPLEGLVSVTSGARHPFGPRFKHHADDEVRLMR